jgi:phospholipid/cholesterol/gamma-HCH transport system substrate-binding protein
MYASRTTQLIVGIFGVIGILALAFLSFRLGDLSLFPPPSYLLYANFDTIAGLKSGDQVEIAGVKVGKVISVALKGNRAQVALRIKDGVEIDSDAIAAIKTAGLLGDKYVSIELGPGERNLANGQTIRQTQSAVVIEDLIGQYINSAGAGGSPKDSGGAKPSTSNGK